MKRQLEAELAAIKRSVLMTKLIGAPGALMLILGIVSLIEDGDKLLSFLDNPGNCYLLICFGTGISLWELWRIARLNRQQNSVQAKLDSLS